MFTGGMGNQQDAWWVLFRVCFTRMMIITFNNVMSILCLLYCLDRLYVILGTNSTSQFQVQYG